MQTQQPSVSDGRRRLGHLALNSPCLSHPIGIGAGHCADGSPRPRTPTAGQMCLERRRRSGRGTVGNLLFAVLTRPASIARARPLRYSPSIHPSTQASPSVRTSVCVRQPARLIRQVSIRVRSEEEEGKLRPRRRSRSIMMGRDKGEKSSIIFPSLRAVRKKFFSRVE